ncbi:helix-turn-helix domain-containing protein [Streptomyces sp. NPDC058664]|uniref:helix-turn-helix domain-containing protein n=1 Tax=unclassified Streptomyces TaxID=2593676 RepID=UPI003666E392
MHTGPRPDALRPPQSGCPPPTAHGPVRGPQGHGPFRPGPVPARPRASRFLLYDLAQTDAYLEGRPIPPLPDGEHPDDLLTAKDVAAILGITPSTVQAYATQGYLSPGTTRYGARLWTRREVHDRRDNAPGQGKGGERRAGEPQGPRKQHAYEGDPRLDTAREALPAAEGAPKGRIAAALAEQHGGTPRTWERLLTAAAAHTGA